MDELLLLAVGKLVGDGIEELPLAVEGLGGGALVELVLGGIELLLVLELEVVDVRVEVEPEEVEVVVVEGLEGVELVFVEEVEEAGVVAVSLLEDMPVALVELEVEEVVPTLGGVDVKLEVEAGVELDLLV